MNRVQGRRGFNLLAMFRAKSRRSFDADDMKLVASWGFDFLRFPLDYRCWADPSEPAKMDRAVLDELARAVNEANSLGLHVCLNFHRAPGYCVNPPPEPRSLWEDEDALEVCALHWRTFAELFKGVGPDGLSFNLLNEPGNVDAPAHEKVVRRLVGQIRSVDPARPIVVDGRRWGREPSPELVELDLIQSTRGYEPMWLSHYRAGWIKGAEKHPPPEWPGRGTDGRLWDRDALKEHYRPWKELNCEVHCGEMGVYSRTPHAVALAWMKDVLAVLSDYGFGWALWNLRGSFGVLDSGREDVAYEETPRGLLDRGMLDVLRSAGKRAEFKHRLRENKRRKLVELFLREIEKLSPGQVLGTDEADRLLERFACRLREDGAARTWPGDAREEALAAAAESARRLGSRAIIFRQIFAPKGGGMEAFAAEVETAAAIARAAELCKLDEADLMLASKKMDAGLCLEFCSHDEQTRENETWILTTWGRALKDPP